MRKNKDSGENRSKTKKLSAAEEYALLTADTPTFVRTAEYLKPLIERAIQRVFLISQDKKQNDILQALMNDIPIAARRFLHNKENKEKNMLFSTYFTWYVAQRINTQKEKTRDE